MRTFNLSHWFITDNRLSASLLRFFVSIDLKLKEGQNYYLLRVVNLDMDIKEFQMKFTTLEEAVEFVEDTVTKCWNFERVMQIYNEKYTSDGKKILKKEKKW